MYSVASGFVGDKNVPKIIRPIDNVKRKMTPLIICRYLLEKCVGIVQNNRLILYEFQYYYSQHYEY